MKKLISMFLTMTLVFIMPGMFAAFSPRSRAAEPEEGPNDLFVSPSGDDSAAGTKDAPLKTIPAAKERLKALKGVVAEDETVRVWLRGGRYEQTEPLAFGPDDLPNVTFASFPGEEALITGSRAITGFSEETVNGVRVFTKTLDPESDPVGFKSLFCGGEQLPVARYPEKGYFKVKATAPEDDLWTAENTPWSLTYGQRSFFADPEDLTEFTNPQDVQVRILHYWHDELMFLTGVDYATGKLSLSRPSSMLIRDIDRYYFENVFEAMNEPGEWYLNTQTEKLYYVPRDGETADSLTLYASSLERLVEIEGVDGISFDRVRFTETDWMIPVPTDWCGEWRGPADIDAPQAAYDVRGVIEVRYAQNVSFTNCEFTNLGASAVKLLAGVKRSRVDSCLFRNIAATGVFVGGTNCRPEEADCTADITVTNNDISGYGRKFFCAIGVQITYCDGAQISHNEISDGYYTAISDGWVWGYSYQLTNNIKITENLVYNIGQGWLSDMGGVYTLGIQPGTVISGNVFHNVAADPGEGGYGGWGVYLDEGSSQILVEKNLVFACGSDSYHLHYGKDNTVRNNIFAMSGESQVRVNSRDEGHKTADFTGNIILTDNGAPAFSLMHSAANLTAENNTLWDLSLGRDVFVCKGGSGDRKMTVKQAQTARLLGNTSVADPMFADAGNFDFTLSSDSAAVKNGFETWDYTAAGTIGGTTVGLALQGGQTAYGDGAHAVTEGVPEGFCRFCGAVHTGFFGSIAAFFHNIFLFFRNLFSTDA
ncbi:MAG: right-handed parallel beta-helix repeat-containing protein [Clostridia bacterium]|nr:right-handed parallel beta-helix repeat-containing protein [Clostridia bacterium]